MGVEGAMPSAEEMVEIRQLVTSGLGEIGPEEVEQTDVEKISSDDVYLAKFFRHVFEAPGEQTEAAAKMILNTLKWRKAQEANSIKEADFPPGIFEKGALFSRNRDKDGRKLLVFCVFKHIKGQEKMEDMKRFFVYMLERLYREEKGEQLTLLFDCRGAGLKNMDMEFVQFIIGTIKDFYPDPLNYILVLEMPWVLNAAFKVIKGWLPPAAVKKIKFLTKTNMNEYVSDENRLEEWGGTDPWQYVWEPEAGQAPEDNKDETKKKVTFAMVQSPSQDSVASIGSSLSINNNNNNTDNSTGAGILAISPSHEVLFAPSAATGDLTAKLQIQNVSQKPVGYKIKTTSPEKYRVRPSTGSLGPGLSASVEIHCSGSGSSAASGAPWTLVRDKFLITGIFLESPEISAQLLQEALKATKPDCQHRLRCQVAGAGPSSASSAPPPMDTFSAHPGSSALPATELDQSRQVANIMKKVNQISVKQEELASQIRLCVQILLILIGLVIVLIVISLFYSNISYERFVESSRSIEASDIPSDNPSQFKSSINSEL